MALTKARLLKHDLYFHRNTLNGQFLVFRGYFSGVFSLERGGSSISGSGGIVSVSFVEHPGPAILGQRVPKGPPNEDPPKSGLRVSVCSFLSVRPMKQLFGRQRPLPKILVFH